MASQAQTRSILSISRALPLILEAADMAMVEEGDTVLQVEEAVGGRGRWCPELVVGVGGRRQKGNRGVVFHERLLCRRSEEGEGEEEAVLEGG